LSAAYASKNGHSVGLCIPTQVKLIPFGVGIKYFSQSLEQYSCNNCRFYLGLGFQPVLLQTNNCSKVVQNTSSWGFGGITKFGCLWNLPRNFFLDFFADYSFVNVGCSNPCNRSSLCSSTNSCCSSYTIYSASFIKPLKANISGAILGIGIGYNF